MFRVKKNSSKIIIAFCLLIICAVCYSFVSSNKSYNPKNIMFIATTETPGGKGILEIYQQLKNGGHDVKISFVPLDLHNGKVIDIDLNFMKKFNKEDVLFPCGVPGSYSKCEKLSASDLNNHTFDYIFVQNPYDINWLLSLKKLTKKLMYIIYGPHLFHQAGISNPNLPGIIDIVFVDSESTANIYRKEYKFPKNRVVVSGYQSYKYMRDYMKANLKHTKETILWLPRWVLSFKERERFEGGSTFLNYHYFFYNYALKNPQINLIIRPHQLIFTHSVANNYLSQEDLDAIFEKFLLLPNVTVSYHETQSLIGDIGSSDIVIADGTSALGEVVVANKPIIYLSNGWNNEFESNTLSKEFKKYIFLAYDPEDIIKHLDNIRKNRYQYPLDYCGNFLCKLKEIKCRIFEKTCTFEEFKKILDPIEDPAKFITDYLSNN